MIESLESKLGRFLIEGPATAAEEGEDDKVYVFAQRMLMRVFSVPSLMTYLADYRVIRDKDKADSFVIQLDFHRLPEEVLDQVERLLAAPNGVKLYKYIKNGSARTGMAIHVSPDDLGGVPYDYAT